MSIKVKVIDPSASTFLVDVLCTSYENEQLLFLIVVNI